MSWTGARDLKAQLARLWERGDLLRPLVDQADAQPIRLALKGPRPSDLAERFGAVRAWVTELQAVPHIRIEWRTLNHRVVGEQRLPHAVWVDTLEAAWALGGRRREAERFAQQVALTRATLPAALPWLARRPVQALALDAQWPRLLAVTQWLQAHPRPGIHLRQVDVPGVHSKFIEAHRSVLLEVLDLVLPPEAIAAERTGVSQFSARYGFLGKPVRIRFRVLDERIALLPGPVYPDITLDADSFARLEVPATRVFITENETNFLSFPAVDGSLVIFGAGYGWEALARAGWLARCEIHYWGDIDTHGFAILDRLRRHFPQVASFLMDRETLMAHEAQWGMEGMAAVEGDEDVAGKGGARGEGAGQFLTDLSRLTEPERALFNDLRDNRIRRGLRLEQERVAYGWVTTALAHLHEITRNPHDPNGPTP